MKPAIWVLLSGALTFGIPLLLAARELAVLGCSTRGGGGGGGDAPRPPLPRDGRPSLPPCLVPVLPPRVDAERRRLPELV